MAVAGPAADTDFMSRLFSAPNGAHLAVAFIALVARMLLGGIPIIGGLISFVLLLVILYHLVRVALNLIRMSPSRV